MSDDLNGQPQVRVWTTAEVVAAYDAGELRGDWGPWRLNPNVLALECHIGHRWQYEVDLERCNTPAEVLDWICQIAGKGWAEEDPTVVAGLVNAIDDILEPQRHLCSWGRSHTLKLGKLRSLIAEAARRWPDMCTSGEAA